MSEETEIKLDLWGWIKTHQYLIYLIGAAVLSTAVAVSQHYRMSAMESQLAEAKKEAQLARSEAQHQVLTSFAFGISGLKETAVILERTAIEQREHNILMVEHCKKYDCRLTSELAHVKDMPGYTKPTEIYFEVQHKIAEIGDQIDAKQEKEQ